MPDLVASIPNILGFGFLGLSFLMLYLGFQGMQTINKSQDPEPAKVSLTRFYLIISLVFMIVAGPLQLFLLWGESVFKPVVVLYLNTPGKTWEKEFGDIYISYRGNQDEPIIGKYTEKQFRHEDTLTIDVSEIKKFIDLLRSQVKASGQNSARNDPAVDQRALFGG